MVAGVSGFVAGIGAQMLLQAIIARVIGPIPALWSRQMLLLVLLLLVPPVLSRLFWTVEIGSSQESFARGLQFGALFWFIVVVFRLL